MRHIKNVSKQRIICLFKQKDGTAVIEFALLAPIFFLLLMGIVEIGLIMFAESMLDGALAHGARIGRTGYTQGEREAYIKSEIIQMSGGILDTSDLVVKTLNYNAHANIGQPEPCITSLCENGLPNIDYEDINNNSQWDVDQGVSGAGIRNRIVLYRATYNWPLFTPLIKHFFNDEDHHELISTVIVKNETF